MRVLNIGLHVLDPEVVVVAGAADAGVDVHALEEDREGQPDAEDETHSPAEGAELVALA